MALREQNNSIFEEKENCSETEYTIRELKELKIQAEERNAYLRQKVLTLYSKLHHDYKTTIYSLILAIYLFENC